MEEFMPELLIGKLKTRYIDEGGKDKPPALLLHGWGCEGETLRSVIDALKDRFRVVAPDLPGFGGSDEPPAPWSVRDYADHILLFCEQTGVKNPLIFAHSMGARVAVMMISRGFNARCMVITGGAGVKPADTKRTSFRTKIYKCGRTCLTFLHANKALERWKRRFGSEDYRNASPVMRGTLVKTVGEDLTPLFASVAIPTLLIWGEKDDATPLADGKIMESRMQNAGLAVIQNAGHYAFLEQTALFLKIMNVFLDDIYKE
jgi:pimeloyl-ACP methyl ester carboxylesterase